MTAMDSIFSRRSIRSYTGEAPSTEEINQILKACYAAPVGMGRYDSLHITVVRDRAYLCDLEAEAGRQLGKEDYHPLYGAPVLLIFSSVFPGIPTDNSSYSNCAILAENAALAAVELGLGTCHIWGAIRALNKAPALLEKLCLPEGFCPAAPSRWAERRKPMRQDRWQTAESPRASWNKKHKNKVCGLRPQTFVLE